MKTNLLETSDTKMINDLLLNKDQPSETVKNFNHIQNNKFNCQVIHINLDLNSDSDLSSKCNEDFVGDSDEAGADIPDDEISYASAQKSGQAEV